MNPFDPTGHSKDIQLNEPAPDFELTDTRGNLVSLSDYRENKNVVLALNRGFL